MTAILALPLELDVISERELDKLKQKVERLVKFLRIRILRGSPKEAVGVWSYLCLHHEESFTDKRHNTIIVAPGHLDFIKNSADGHSTHHGPSRRKSGEIQGQIRQHSRLINTMGVRQTRIGVNRIGCDAADCKQERYFETSNEMRSVLIKIGSNGFDHRLGQKGCRRKLPRRARHKPHCDAKCRRSQE